MNNRLKSFTEFLNESQQDFSPEELKKFEKYELDISKVTKNSDGSIDYDGNVDLTRQGLHEIPFNFRRVSGRFWCPNNQLTSLKGAPQIVDGSFWCSSNELKSLEGAPLEVTGYFWCEDNRLTSLEGAPSEVTGDFRCEDNRLTSLEGAPSEVRGNFWCQDNQLTSLKGAPSEVTGYFACYDNQLTSLKGAPREVGGDFWCRDNQLLSLKVPSKVLGKLSISGNDFRDSLKFFIEEKSSGEQREILNDLREFDGPAYRKVLQSLKDQGIELESVSKEEHEWNEEAKGIEDTGLEF